MYTSHVLKVRVNLERVARSRGQSVLLQEVCRQHGKYSSEGWGVGASMLSTKEAAPGPREMAATASSTETSPRVQPYLPKQANENSVDICPTADSLDPDLLLPADVLQRARSIINEHLAEHQMPPVESLSDFNVQDAPRPHVSQNRAAPLQNHSIGSSGRRPTRPEATDRPFQYAPLPVIFCSVHTSASRKSRCPALTLYSFVLLLYLHGPTTTE